MKNILTILFIAVTVGCVKEAELENQIQLDNLYIIKDNPNDTIQHRIYRIYKDYGVSVYFNDTIAKTFVASNFQKDSIVQYECVDFGYTFTGYDNLTYHYNYMTDSLEKMKAIAIIETYLKKSSPKLHPLLVLVTTSLKTIASNSIEKIYQRGDFRIGYRSLLLTGGWLSDKMMNELPDKIIQQTVIDKISQFSIQLTRFKLLSNKEWYDCFWGDINKDMSGLDVGALAENWWQASQYTPEELAALRVEIREKIGRYGFVSKNRLMGGIGSPVDSDDDLSGFVTEIFRYPSEEFIKYWGRSPLVMQKYEILMMVIQNELGIEF